MSIMPENHNNDSRINDSIDFRDGYAEGFVDAIAMKPAVPATTVSAVARVAARRSELTDEQRTAILAAIDAGTTSPAERLINEAIVRWNQPYIICEHGWKPTVCPKFCDEKRRADCPDWCVIDHRGDDDRDDLVLHQADDHTEQTVRELLDAHRLSMRVTRTDNTAESSTGKPVLYVSAELELTTWEQAAELARAIIDGFGYLEGAEG